jgi:hypothetical protein
MYAELDQKLTAFESLIDSSWNGVKHPVAFGAEHFSASSDNYDVLLTPDYYTRVLTELTRMKAMGMQAVTLSVHHPLLYAPFFRDQNLYRQYSTFYRKLAGSVKALGMKLIIETQTVFPGDDPMGLQIEQFYQSMNFTQHIDARATTARTIAELMQPDYLTVSSEPDTEADLTGHEELNTVSGAAQLVGTVAARVQSAGIPGLKVGAGSGTWLYNYVSLTNTLCRDTPIDYFSIHIYPASLDFLQRAIQIGDIAKSHGKSTGVGEAWLYKFTESEIGTGLSPFVIFGRDPYSFWGPLDVKFLRTMVKLSHYKKFEFFSAFWSRFFYSYIPYNQQTKDLSPQERIQLGEDTANAAMAAGQFTGTAAAYTSYIGP